MAIYRVKVDRNYTVVQNAIISDPRLSWKAKGMLVYLLSKPGDWIANPRDISRNGKDGIDSVRSGLKELIEARYVRYRGRERTQGKLGLPIYDVYDTPFSPNGEKPNQEKPNQEKPNQENPTLISTEYNQVLNIPSTEITKNNTDFKKSSSYGEQEKELLKYINQRLGRNYRQEKKFQTNLKARLKSGYTVEQIKGAFDRAVDDDFHRKNNYKHLSPEFICRSDKLEKFLNAPVEAKKKGAKFIKVANV